MTDEQKKELTDQWNTVMDEINTFVLLLLETSGDDDVPFNVPVEITRVKKQ